MATNNATLGPDAHRSNDERPVRGREGRKTSRDDRCIDTDKEASQGEPPHGHISHGAARFLLAVDPDTPLNELGDRYREWLDGGKPRRAGQSGLKRWSE